jgi:ABC-type bacteriocin/lantibiotic exporter with double-glycine peptidase domain
MFKESIIDKLLHTKQGNILISIILGLGLAMLFKPICHNCIEYISPDLRKEHNKKYNINNNCYQNIVIPIKCKGNELKSKL